MYRSHTPEYHGTTEHHHTNYTRHRSQKIKFSNPQKTNSAKGGNHPAKRRQDALHQGQDYSTGQAQVQCRKKAKLRRSYSKSYRHQRRDIKTQNRQTQSRACCTSRLTTKRKTTQRTYFNLAARCGTDKRKGKMELFAECLPKEYRVKKKRMNNTDFRYTRTGPPRAGRNRGEGKRITA